MIRLLDRYVLRQFLTTFTLMIVGLPLLFVIFDVTDRVDRYLNRGLPPGDVALSYVFEFPKYVLWSFPIAALIATVFTIGSMTRHQELVAAKAGGVSFHRLVRPILAAGALLMMGALALGELVPTANQRAAELRGEHRRLTSFRSNFVFNTESGQSLSVRRLDADNQQMFGVLLEGSGRGGAPGLHQLSERASWTAGDGWTLENGHLRLLSTDGRESSFTFQSARLPSLRESPAELLAEPKEPDEMRYHELTRAITTIERGGGNVNELLVKRAQKISIPVAVLVIILFGAPLVTSSQRGGAAFGLGLSLGVTLVYMMLFRVGQAVGTSGAMDPLLAAWLPNLLFFAAGLVFFVRVRT
jgi:lipopolysaccharide export system permease protein